MAEQRKERAAMLKRVENAAFLRKQMDQLPDGEEKGLFPRKMNKEEILLNKRLLKTVRTEKRQGAFENLVQRTADRHIVPRHQF